MPSSLSRSCCCFASPATKPEETMSRPVVFLIYYSM